MALQKELGADILKHKQEAKSLLGRRRLLIPWGLLPTPTLRQASSKATLLILPRDTDWDLNSHLSGLLIETTIVFMFISHSLPKPQVWWSIIQGKIHTYPLAGPNDNQEKPAKPQVVEHLPELCFASCFGFERVSLCSPCWPKTHTLNLILSDGIIEVHYHMRFLSFPPSVCLSACLFFIFVFLKTGLFCNSPSCLATL